MPKASKEGKRKPGPDLATKRCGATSETGAKAPPTIMFISLLGPGRTASSCWSAGGVMTGGSREAPGSEGMIDEDSG